MSKYLVGQPAVIYIENIKNNAGVLTNPAVIRLRLRHPDGAIDIHEVADLTHTGTGAYSYDLVAPSGEGGTWGWRYEHENPTNAIEGTIVIDESALLAGDAQQPITGPCSAWTDYDEVLARGSFPAGTVDEQVYQAIDAASDMCFQMGGRRWPGVCDATVQVHNSGTGLIPWPEGGVVSMRPSHWWGWWAPAGTEASFSCADGRTLSLPGPVLSISAIRVDGVTLDPAAYTIVDWTEVIRLDGQPWPSWGSMFDTTPHLEIDYSYGQAPPQMGRIAAAALARELVLALAGSDACRLDRRVTSIVREGVSEDMALGLPGIAESLRDGQTGIPEVDLFVHAHNPHGLRRPARFLGLGTSGVSRRS